MQRANYLAMTEHNAKSGREGKRMLQKCNSYCKVALGEQHRFLCVGRGRMIFHNALELNLAFDAVPIPDVE